MRDAGLPLRSIRRFTPAGEAALPGQHFNERHGTASVYRVWRSQPPSAAVPRMEEEDAGGEFSRRAPCLACQPRLLHAPTTGAYPPIWPSRRGGRVVECTALEMRHRCKPIGGSNPSLSATMNVEEFNSIASRQRNAGAQVSESPLPTSHRPPNRTERCRRKRKSRMIPSIRRGLAPYWTRVSARWKLFSGGSDVGFGRCRQEGR